jgi:hypothetical protein
VIVVVLTAIGVASALVTRERARRLARLPVEGLWLVWLAIVVQVVLFEFAGQHLELWLSNTIHLLTYALCVAFLVRNRRLPGAWIIIVGTTCNLAAITANGGTMPASADAWRRAGLPAFEPDVFENSRSLSSPRLAFLGDVFAVPAGWPLANVFSIGDVLIVIGGTYLAHRWCAAPEPVTATSPRPALVEEPAA